MKISFLTSHEFRSLTDDDRLAASALERLGHKVMPLVWDDPKEIELIGEQDLNVVRSTWDYVEKLEQFKLFINHEDQVGLQNERRLLQWNLNKTYLRELQSRGVRIIPTLWLKSPDDQLIQKWADEHAPQGYVIKRSISAGGGETFLFQPGERWLKYPTLRFSEEELMIQPLFEEIRTQGEWSLLFFNGEFSHGVVKKPAMAEFRVQERLGGTVESAVAPGDLIEQAKWVVQQAPVLPLYARVDGIWRDKKLHLMELEVLEPSLFLAQSPGSEIRFAHAILSRL
ncbi:MAG: hypothetical protein IT289_01775 [Oligoflexia bacterium]|nr:hypothetical protein [Oligoflexia bacterium]